MTLYPYQEQGVEFLTQHKRAYLADEMGLGKSVQAIVAAQQIGARNILVVCPASVVPHWQAEFRRWWGGALPTVRIISYATAIRRKLGLFDLLIADEAHYLKTPSAKRTRRILGTARHIPWVWLLSGTPMPNAPHELWAVVRALWPEHRHGCTTKVDWMYKFSHVHETIYGPKPVGIRNPELLRASLQQFMLRRKLKDVGIQLPPLRVDLTRIPEPANFSRVVEEYKDDYDTEDLYTSTLRRLLGTAKAPAIAHTVIEELQDGAYRSIVVMYYHRDTGTALRDAFSAAGIQTVGYDGSANTTERASAVRAFQDGRAPIFLAQQIAAGEGINLTQGSEIVLVEPEWTPAPNEQAIKRIHRIGQDTPCRARIFAATGTLDEAIMGTIHQKVQMQLALGLEGGTNG